MLPQRWPEQLAADANRRPACLEANDDGELLVVAVPGLLPGFRVNMPNGT
jgi:hypothetical protein